ncbi:hypothetical protein HPP92_025133 [Vanilla planifolia]|uniref:Uncharacterized protein n=1 Tax=Vanilla planifolia TaxID=51239 RepID=A0A835PIH6_VANPL|nr:hypothetical protein HPP92_025133 [Vanilla planifolia]
MSTKIFSKELEMSNYGRRRSRWTVPGGRQWSDHREGGRDAMIESQQALHCEGCGRDVRQKNDCGTRIAGAVCYEVNLIGK